MVAISARRTHACKGRLIWLSHAPSSKTNTLPYLIARGLSSTYQKKTRCAKIGAEPHLIANGLTRLLTEMASVRRAAKRRIYTRITCFMRRIIRHFDSESATELHSASSATQVFTTISPGLPALLAMTRCWLTSSRLRASTQK